MNRLAVALASLALVSGSALAADLPAPAPAPAYKSPAVVPPAYSWTGVYLNAGGGGALWNSDTQIFSPAGACVACGVNTVGGHGFLATAGGGFDYQFGGLNFGSWNPTIVAGLMADYNYEDFRGTAAINPAGLLGQIKETGAWAAGARIGLAFGPNLFVYSNGGVTGTRFSGTTFVSSTTGVPAGFSSNGFWQTGWFLGGGSETSLTPILPVGWFLRSEYRYSYFGTKNVAILGAGGATAGQMGWHPTVQMLSTSLVYKFNFLN
jgi:outer membrane immunogenic protein